MKIVGIGDLLIPPSDIENGFKRLADLDCETIVINWPLQSYEELQHINLLVEQGGSEVIEPPEIVLDAIRDADVIITQFCPVTKHVIDSCPKLKAIGVLRGGVENINVPYASEKGILVFNTPGRNANAVADFTVGMLIAECRNIAKAHDELKKGNWVRDYTNAACVPDLCEKTVGIVGYGNIGRKVAKRLRAFDMQVIAYDPYVSKADADVEMVSLEELLRRSDFVTLHSRMTDSTYHMIDEHMLSLMKPTAYLINTARSGLVDEEALYRCLKDRKIMGAALDVFDLEPPGKDYPLVTLDNITITPHLAGGTRDAFSHSPVLLLEELKEVLLHQKRSGYLLNGNACAENPILTGNW